MEALSHDEDPEPSLRDVMSVLGEISARLSVNEEKVDNLTSQSVVQGLAGEPEPSTSRGAERRGRPTSTTQDSHDALHRVEDQVRASIASHIHQWSPGCFPAQNR